MENSILDSEQLELESDYRDYLAPKWKRFVNFLIDVYGIQILFGLGYGLLLDADPEGLDGVLVNIYGVSIMLLVYFFSEYNTGKTLGKLITGTKVVSIEGGNLKMSQIIYRTLSRIVPFEPLSAFGNAWHDSWTDTAVVNNNFPG